MKYLEDHGWQWKSASEASRKQYAFEVKRIHRVRLERASIHNKWNSNMYFPEQNSSNWKALCHPFQNSIYISTKQNNCFFLFQFSLQRSRVKSSPPNFSRIFPQSQTILGLISNFFLITFATFLPPNPNLIFYNSKFKFTWTLWCIIVIVQTDFQQAF